MKSRPNDEVNAARRGLRHVDWGIARRSLASQRQALLSAMVVVAAGIVVAPAAAQGTPPIIKTPLPKPLPTVPLPAPLKVTRPPHIANVRLALESAGYYSTGSIQYEAEVVNPTGNPELQGALVLEGGSGRSTVRVPAGESAWIKIADTSGLDHGCRPMSRAVALEGIAGTNRLFQVVPACRFSGEVIDPSASLPPDRKLAQRQGKLYYHSMSQVGDLRCGDLGDDSAEGRVLAVTATIRNSGAVTARDVRLRFRGFGGPHSLDVPPGQERRVQATVRFEGDQRDYVLEISGSGVPLHQPLSFVRTTRRCRLSVVDS